MQGVSGEWQVLLAVLHARGRFPIRQVQLVKYTHVNVQPGFFRIKHLLIHPYSSCSFQSHPLCVLDPLNAVPIACALCYVPYAVCPVRHKRLPGHAGPTSWDSLKLRCAQVGILVYNVAGAERSAYRE